MVRNQVLPDGLGIPSTAQLLLDELSVGFAGTDPARGGAGHLRKRAYKVGGHFVAGSGVTSLAGFAGARLPQARGIRMAIPAALR